MLLELGFLIMLSMISTGWGTLIIIYTFLIMKCLSMMNLNFNMLMSMSFQLNSVSVLLIFLSVLLIFLSLISTPEEKSYSYYLCLNLLSLFLVLAFSSSNMLSFYMFFEASLLPTLALIITWGYQPERLQAGTYMMVYTVGASLPLLIVILWVGHSVSSLDVYLLSLANSTQLSLVCTMCIFGAFLVKLPIYGVHLWLPKAHVEAPLAGSMILAGILLKLGGYGLILMSCSLNMSINNYTIFIISLSMWGGFLATLMCLRQADVKALVAYSSVGHMSIVAAGVLLNNSWGLMSSVITMLAHGFCSSGMFCLAYYTYKKSHTRHIPYMKGMIKLYPIISLLWFIFCCVNMACPPTLNLMGEMAIIPSLFRENIWLVIIMGLMIFFSASYNMYLYSQINHGAPSGFLLGSVNLKSYTKTALFFHAFPLLLIFKSTIFVNF